MINFCCCVLLTLIVVPNVYACKTLATSELETVFCTIKARKPSAVPYSLNEFRKNPMATQRLLLMRPAKRLGIPIPVTEVKAAVKVSPEVRVPSIKKTAEQRATSVKKAQNHTPVQGLTPHGAHVNASGRLSGCVLRGREIKCDDGLYRLLDNQPNSQLAENAFEQRLILPRYEGEANNLDLRKHYVIKCYQIYVERMVALGLAGSTLSFTKFFHTYEQVNDLGANFVERMATMYEFLKKDKATIGIARSHDTFLPEDLKKCGRLTAQILVCDNVKHNWIYRLAVQK